jgi:hypothetical protein
MSGASWVRGPPFLSNCLLKVATILEICLKQANANEKSILVIKGEKELKTMIKNILAGEE